VDGGFAEYCTFLSSKLVKISKLSWTEASLVEATACAIHGLDRLGPVVGFTVLILGSGPTGLCLSQLLKRNGAVHVAVASFAGIKMDLAKRLEVADNYIEFNRENAEPQWLELEEHYQQGFDVVIEATGDPSVLERSLNICSKGGKVVFYGVYPPDGKISISPSRIFHDEITILG
jgi:D-arabinitol dehydrogenase (NADP+)